MVAGYHLIWTVYGFWLPNDLRGSTSRELRVEKIKALGEIHHGRKQVQPSRRELGAFMAEAQERLAHPVLTFDDDAIALIGNVIGGEIAAKGYICYACAVMPDHVHLLIRRGRDYAETMIEHFQETARTALIAAGKRTATHPVWTKGPGWKGFINTREGFETTVAYIRQNPIKIGRPEQQWNFVTSYDGWLPSVNEK